MGKKSLVGAGNGTTTGFNTWTVFFNHVLPTADALKRKQVTSKNCPRNRAPTVVEGKKKLPKKIGKKK